MKKFNKLLCFMLVFITGMAAFCTMSFAATVGDRLTAPEVGWQRIETSDSHFVSYWISYAYASSSGGSYLYTANNNDKLTFKFYGTKIRLIGGMFSHNRVSSNILSIDGVVYNFSEYSSSDKFQSLVAEATNLSLGVHSVEVYSTSLTTSLYIDLDAIDIDSTGYLVDYYSPSNLTAVPGSTNVDLAWDAIDGATSYIVKRSETPGGPYTTTFSAISAAFTDTTVTNGTTYYYVVTSIVNGVENGPSNEASTTPTAPTDPEPSGNSAILELTMVTGEIKEYDLTATELQSFLTWYDGRSNGADKAYYMIPKKNNIKPFLSRKEYIAFDKISSFEVKEYTE